MYVIDNVLIEGNMPFLNKLTLLLILVQLVAIIAYFLHGYLLEAFRQRVFFDLQKTVFAKVLELPMSYFQANESGYILSRVRNDTETTKGLMADTIISLLKDVATLAVGVVCLFVLHWKLALFSCLLLPPFVISILNAGKHMKKMNSGLQEASAQLNKEVAEDVSLVASVKALGIHKSLMRKYVSALRHYIDMSFRTSMYTAIFGGLTSLIGAAGPILLLWYGGSEIISGALTFGRFFAFSMFLSYLFGPTQRLLNLNISIQASLAAIDRVFEVLDHPSEPTTVSAGALRDARGRVEFRNVAYSHNGSKPIIDDVSFVMEPGHLFAIAGRSGIGKTTILNLLMGYYLPLRGEIIVDGINTRLLGNASLRAHIGFVPQGAPLFSTSIRENIRYGNLEATDEEIVDAATLANAHHFISHLKDQYRTLVGERGVKLSGGERQRIAIARAIVRKPTIFVLDESLSEVDLDSEALIMQSLLDLKRTATVIVVAHRPSTVQRVDRVFFLETGRIVACGTHHDLLTFFPPYERLLTTAQTD